MPPEPRLKRKRFESAVDPDIHDSDSMPPPSSLPPSKKTSSRTPSTPRRTTLSQRSADNISTSASKESARSTGTLFTEGTKTRVKNLYDQLCWFCDRLDPEVAHVVAQADTTFSDLKALGRFSITAPSVFENAIPLCPSCHNDFDKHWQPRCIIIPTDLAFFIEMELAYHQEQSIQPAVRVPPTSSDYAAHCGLGEEGTYQRYIAKQVFGPGPTKPQVGPYLDPKTWHGDPMAMLHRAFRHIATEPNGIPQTVRGQLRDLQELYVAGDQLQFSANSQTGVPSHNTRPDSDVSQRNPARPESSRPGGSSTQPPANQNNSSTPQDNPPRPNMQTRSAAPDTPLSPPTTSANSPSTPGQTNFRAPERETRMQAQWKAPQKLWKYGPQKTAQDAINYRRDVIQPIINGGRKRKAVEMEAE